VPRHGAKIFLNGSPVGEITSGTFSPTLQEGIAMGYLPHPAPEKVSVEIRGRKIPAVVTSTSFLKR